jgi:hypothetical protein
MSTEIWIVSAEVVGGRPGGKSGNTDRMPDITGFEVSARDGDIGKVEEVVQGPDGRTYLVVDTGFWIFEKKRMVPAGIIDTIDVDNRRVNARVTKDDIRKAPDYEAQQRDDDSVRSAHEAHYGQHAPS